MCKINIEFSPHRRQCSVRSIKQGFRGEIVCGPEPLSFKYSPKGFRYIQMWRVWRQEEKEQSTFFPYRPEFFHELISVYPGIVQDDERVFLYPERKAVEKVRYFSGRNVFCRAESVIAVISAYHTEYIKPERPLGRHKDILTPELPAIRHISFRAYMAFVSEVKVYETVVCLSFEFLQLLGLIRVELRRGFTLGTFPYTSISRANADKKALKVLSEASLPDACCQASLAFLTLCLSFSMATRTASSSEQSIMGLRPRPGRVSSPLMPSSLKRFTQAFTDMCVISVCRPIAFEVKPCDFNRTARQRIRKQWLSPFRKPFSNCRRSESVNDMILIFAIAVAVYGDTQRYKDSVI